MTLNTTRKQDVVVSSPVDYNMAEQIALAGSADNPVVDIAVEQGEIVVTTANGSITRISVAPGVKSVNCISNDAANAGSKEDGGIYNPYMTIQAGLDATSFGVAYIYPGSYTENIMTTPTNQTVNTGADEAGYRVRIVGDVIIQSPVSSTWSNIEIEGNLTIILSSATQERRASLLYMNNIAVNGNVIVQGDGGFVQFDRNCEFMGNVHIVDNVQFVIKDSQFEADQLTVGGNAIGLLDNVKYVTLSLEGGRITAIGNTIFQPRGSYEAIVVSGTGTVFIGLDAICIDPATLQLQPITVMAGSVFSFGAFICDYANSALAGTELNLANVSSRNILYAPTNESVEDVLKRINPAIIDGVDLSGDGSSASVTINGIKATVTNDQSTFLYTDFTSENEIVGAYITRFGQGSGTPNGTRLENVTINSEGTFDENNQPVRMAPLSIGAQYKVEVYLHTPNNVYKAQGIGSTDLSLCYGWIERVK